MARPESTTIDAAAQVAGELIADAVGFRFAHFELAPVSLQARAGELTAIIGPNGSGKSTLLEISPAT